MAPRLAGVVLTVSLLAAAGCSSSDEPSARSSTSSTPSGPTSTSRPARTVPTTASPAVHDRAVVHGTATLNGAPFDAEWVGAVVLRDGLVTPCQTSLPPVTKGKYSLSVYAETESSGCGTTGARVALWTYADGKILYSDRTIDWPGDGIAAAFAPRYSTATPARAVPVTAQFSGTAFRRDLTQLPPGTKIEAYVGTTRCGVASIRASKDFRGYALAVVGPDSIPGCTRGAPLTFRLDGKPAAKTEAVNTPPGRQGALDLALP